MLEDFYQFLEYTRARNAQQSAQHFHNEQIYHEQQRIPSLLNTKSNFQNKASTPKRTRPLNESSRSISSVPKQHKPNTNTSKQNEQNEQAQTENDQTRKPLPFDQLKRVVSSNLPCFFIEFNQSTSAHKLPSAFEARNFIENHFKEHSVRIQHFSLVGWTKNRLKLGVNNKEDYMKLITTDVWPTTIKNIPVKTVKPKYIPDCFALVVRYVPRNLELDFVKEEITRTIASANNIKQIHYSYDRKTNDFRFTVMDLTEYNTARELGRISIGNHWLSVTPFLSGNRLTYCTRCWKLGHLRDQCETNVQHCRICLQEITKKNEHLCNNKPKCAQCDGEHHSLNSQCRIIQQYRANLKEDVNKALESGKLHRNTYTTTQSNTNILYKMNEGFSPLGKPKTIQESAWNRITSEASIDTAADSTKLLVLINQNLVEMRESSRRAEEKLEKIIVQVNQTALDTELHQTTVNKLIDCVQLIVKNVLGPVTSQVQLDLTPGLQAVYDNLKDLKTNLNNDYEIRRKHSTSPNPLITNNQISQMEDTANGNASSMNNHK